MKQLSKLSKLSVTFAVRVVITFAIKAVHYSSAVTLH